MPIDQRSDRPGQVLDIEAARVRRLRRTHEGRAVVVPQVECAARVFRPGATCTAIRWAA